MRNALWVFATITAMGMGTAAAATHAARTTDQASPRKTATAKPRKNRAAESPSPAECYEERVIPAPAAAQKAQNARQSPTKQLSHAGRRQV